MDAGGDNETDLMSGDVVLDDIHDAGGRSRPGGIIDNKQNVPGVFQEISQAGVSERICQRLANDFGFIADFDFIRLDEAEDALLVDLGLKLAVFAVWNTVVSLFSSLTLKDRVFGYHS